MEIPITIAGRDQRTWPRLAELIRLIMRTPAPISPVRLQLHWQLLLLFSGNRTRIILISSCIMLNKYVCVYWFIDLFLCNLNQIFLVLFSSGKIEFFFFIIISYSNLGTSIEGDMIAALLQLKVIMRRWAGIKTSCCGLHFGFTGPPGRAIISTTPSTKLTALEGLVGLFLSSVGMLSMPAFRLWLFR